MLRMYQPELDATQTRQYSKTPARGALQTKSLLKSENKVGGVAAGKGKHVALVPHTPAVPKSTKAAPKTTNTNRGALQDKTPHANRFAHQTPAPGGTRKKPVAATPFQPVKEQSTPPSSQSLPSATRTRVRAPRNVFETPLPSGNHWDISDGSIDLQGPSNALSVSTHGIVEEDYDEIEYMPPTAVVPDYEPPFDMPDYKQLGAGLKNSAHIIHFEDEADWDPHADFDVDNFLPPSPTTPTLLSCGSESDDDRDLFPNVKRAVLAPPPPVPRSSRPPVQSSKMISSLRMSKPAPPSRPSVVPARAPSRAPARPTAPTPGAGRPSAAPSRARPSAPAPTRQPAALKQSRPTTTVRPQPPRPILNSRSLSSRPSHSKAPSLALSIKPPPNRAELVIHFDDDDAFDMAGDDFVLDVQ